jgi:photosystem II stability/assembly factor-like uncharacterized protein
MAHSPALYAISRYFTAIYFATTGVKMQLRRSVILALMIIAFILFETHSCSEDRSVEPDPGPEISNELLGANDVFFVDADHGWVVGRMGTAVLTDDGGDTWTAVRIGDIDIRGVYFSDPVNGWVVGREGKLYVSADGGYTWERQIFTGTPEMDDLFEVRFVSENEGFILGYHGVFVTEDGGSDWVNNWLPIVEYRGAWSMAVVDGECAFLMGSRWTESDPELLYVTEDGGIFWSAVPGSNASILRGIVTVEFADRQTGWAGGGSVMKTVDGGRSWTTQLESATVREFFVKDALNVVGVGKTSVIITSDGGEHWFETAPADERISDLRAVYFSDISNGWIAGTGREEMIDGRSVSHAVVLRTSDGGMTWSVREFAYETTGLEADAPEEIEIPSFQ